MAPNGGDGVRTCNNEKTIHRTVQQNTENYSPDGRWLPLIPVLCALPIRNKRLKALDDTFCSHSNNTQRKQSLRLCCSILIAMYLRGTKKTSDCWVFERQAFGLISVGICGIYVCVPGATQKQNKTNGNYSTLKITLGTWKPEQTFNMLRHIFHGYVRCFQTHRISSFCFL